MSLFKMLITEFTVEFLHPALRYDSLTGVPSCQRALAFEKGSVLFNIGALYTQIGARQDRSVAAGIDRAIDAFQRAAGTEVTRNHNSTNNNTHGPRAL